MYLLTSPVRGRGYSTHCVCVCVCVCVSVTAVATARVVATAITDRHVASAKQEYIGAAFKWACHLIITTSLSSGSVWSMSLITTSLSSGSVWGMSLITTSLSI